MTPDYTNEHDAIVDEDHLVHWAGTCRQNARDLGCNWERFTIADQGKYIYRAWRKRPVGAYTMAEMQQIPANDMLVADPL